MHAALRARRAERVAARLPKRYHDPWLEPFEQRCLDGLPPGARVLDIGGGRRPSIPPGKRPAGCVYVGLDTSPEQLRKAGPDAYDEVHVASATDRLPELEQ